MKSLDYLEHINVLMLTGLNNAEMNNDCIRLGALAVLHKPFDQELFEEILRTSLLK